MTSESKLRTVESDDHEWLVELHNDPAVLRNLTDSRPITLESHMRWWVNLDHDREERRVFTIDGTRIGFCKFTHDRPNRSVCLGADIHKTHRGKGLARGMWELMLDHVFAGPTHRAWLTTADYNVVGQRVYEGLGFVIEGRMEESLYRAGEYRDQIVMRMMRREWLARCARRGQE